MKSSSSLANTSNCPGLDMPDSHAHADTRGTQLPPGRAGLSEAQGKMTAAEIDLAFTGRAAWLRKPDGSLAQATVVGAAGIDDEMACMTLYFEEEPGFPEHLTGRRAFGCVEGGWIYAAISVGREARKPVDEDVEILLPLASPDARARPPLERRLVEVPQGALGPRHIGCPAFLYEGRSSVGWPVTIDSPDGGASVVVRNRFGREASLDTPGTRLRVLLPPEDTAET